MSLATWCFDIFLWTAVVLIGTAVVLDMLNERDN